MRADRIPPVLFICLSILASVGLSTPQAWGQDEQVDFARDIQPLLARRCYACHGPDDAEGGLRLNSREGALAVLESGEHAIVPGNADESSLLIRIAEEDESLRMPPEGKPLTDEEQALLRSWIENGAEWKQHWAFAPIVRPAVPFQAPGEAGTNPVDAFIDAKLKEKGLQRNPPASPIAQLRRIYLDITGLPPTPEETADFLKRAAGDFDLAYQQEVDKLLASDQYGERWARHWLDVVRYAETNSFERDGPKPHAWRYRDYVIRSLNEDKPYDQFLREQLAGDELPEITKDSLVATGFYRLGIWDDEPADRELAMYDGFDDILTTVGQGILGLTVNCSRCHDHKIDPIPAADYYSMLAFFRNITPNGYGPNTERALVATEADRQRYQEAEQAIRENGDRLQAELSQVESQLQQQLNELSAAKASIPDLANARYQFYRDTFDALPNFDELKFEDSGVLDPPYFDISKATRENEFGFVFNADLIVPEDGNYTFVLDSDDGSRLTIDGKTILEYDGIHGTGNPKRSRVTLAQGRHPIRVDYFQRLHGKGLHLSWSGPGFKRRWLTAESQNQGGMDLNQALNSELANDLDQALVARFRQLRKEIEVNSRKKPWDEYGLCVSEHGTQAAETFVLHRGSPEAKGEKVEPRFLSILGGDIPEVDSIASANSSGRRLAFANWVTSPENRLTSRVIVNRIWQHHFGRGIVRSANNFGQLGDAPTHPELLDWLAVELMQSGWKLKPLHRIMMLSQAYRQSSVPSAAASEHDPSNDWFSHFNMRRLSAEEVRDAILATNGSLNKTMYGPSIYPKISAEVLAGQSVPGKGWERSSEADQARRSIYIHIKRSLMVPLLASFDFPETDTPCEARFITVQPGQALGMLNGDFLNEQSAILAQRVRSEAGTDLSQQMTRAYELIFSRQPSEQELSRVAQLNRELQTEHQLSADEALSYCCLFLYNLNEFMYVD